MAEKQIKAYSISVIIPAYNAGERLRVAIESVLAQDFRATEILVIDDGSKDNTAEIASEYPQVTCIRQENAGASAARNRGVRDAHGECITFLDADDYWYPNRLADTVEILQANPELQWCGGVYEEQAINGRVKTVGATKAALRLLRNNQYFDNFYQASLAGAYFHTCCMTIRADVFCEIGYFDETLNSGEDMDLWWRIADSHSAVGYVIAPVFRYVRCESSLTTRPDQDMVERYRRFLQKLPEQSFAFEFRRNSARALFFRCFITKMVRHALRLGNNDMVREIYKKKGDWISISNKVAIRALAFLPGKALRLAARFYRRISGRECS